MVAPRRQNRGGRDRDRETKTERDVPYFATGSLMLCQ